MYLNVISKPQHWGGLGPLGLSNHKKHFYEFLPMDILHKLRIWTNLLIIYLKVLQIHQEGCTCDLKLSQMKHRTSTFMWPCIVVRSWSCSNAVHKPVWHIPLLSVQWINSWWWTEELSETCRVSCQNKFMKLVHLVGFIKKKHRTFRAALTGGWFKIFVVPKK
jgi:hypothetical protein